MIKSPPFFFEFPRFQKVSKAMKLTLNLTAVLMSKLHKPLTFAGKTDFILWQSSGKMRESLFMKNFAFIILAAI